MAVHCMNLPTSKARDGYIGISDFRGDLIRLFQDAGFIYHSEVCIWKDPVTAMQRTKALGLLYKQLKKDSACRGRASPTTWSSHAKPGDNPEPVTKDPRSTSRSICGSGTPRRSGSTSTPRHAAEGSAREQRRRAAHRPLQLEVIRRAIRLWTNPGDLVFSPFAGIGSEGYERVLFHASLRQPESSDGIERRPIRKGSMSSQQQFDLDFSGKLPVSAQIGRQTSDENANEYWKHIFDACVVAVAKRQEYLTSDDVLAEFESLPHAPKTHNLAAIGGVMHRAKAMGVVAPTNSVKRSERPEKHGNRQNVWKSLYWRKP
jgi:hypothetical protein